MRFLKPTRGKNQELYIGLVRLHVLHHAAEGPIFGLGIIQELGRHGYKLGPGTIYPLLHGMERRGWLGAEFELVNGHKRKVYAATATGRKALAQARNYVRELYLEMGEGEQKESSPVPRVMKPIRRDNKRG
ncbi:MAG: PadR family transcriptional regulator [Terracidiphilus sp.]